MSFLTRCVEVSQPAQLGDLFTRFRTWKEWKEVVVSHPELLSEDADRFLSELLVAAHGENDATAIQIFEEHRALLKRCREVGAEQAFAEKLKEVPPPLKLLLELSQIPPEEQRAIGELITYENSPEERAAVLKKYPILITALDEVLTGTPPPRLKAFDTSGRVGTDESDRTADEQAAALAAWERIIQHPGFATSPETFQMSVLNDAGQAFFSKYKESGHNDDLNLAGSLLERVIRLVPANSPDRPTALHNLCVCYHDLYARGGDPAALDKAIELSSQALQLAPSAPVVRAHNLSDLAISLRYRYRSTGEIDNLRQAIEAWRQVVELSPPGSSERAMMLHNLSIGFRDLYARTGDVADFRQYIEAGQQALQLVQPDTPNRAGFLLLQGVYLRDVYKRVGDLAALQTAIESLRQAALQASPTAPNRDLILASLGSALFNSYQRTNNHADLRQAIEAWRQAVELSPPGSRNGLMIYTTWVTGYAPTAHLTDNAKQLETLLSIYTGPEASPPNAPDQVRF